MGHTLSRVGDSREFVSYDAHDAISFRRDQENIMD